MLLLKKWLKPIPEQMYSPRGEPFQFYKEINGHGWVTITQHTAELRSECGTRLFIFIHRLTEQYP
jgi:hypothetical protein